MDASIPIVGRVRGAAAGTLCAGAALPAHSLGGGELPSSGTLIVLAAFGATIGAVVARSSGRLPGLIAALWVGQLVGHLLLGAMAGHGTPWSTAMLASHTVAAVVVGVCLWFGEHLVALLASSVRRWLVRTSPHAPAEQRNTPRIWSDSADHPQFLIGSRAPTRGPPVALAR